MNYRTIGASIVLISTFVTHGCSSNNDNDPVNMDPNNDNVGNGIILLNSKEVDTAVEKFLETTQAPGIAVAIVTLKSGNLVVSGKGYGVTEIDTTTPVDVDTAFWLGSVSKSFVGTLMMMDQEEGLLDIDEDILTNVSSLGGFSIDDPANRKISMRTLASHTSPIRDSDNYDCAYYVNNDDGTYYLLYNEFDEKSNCPEQGAVSLNIYLANYLSANGAYYSGEENFSNADSDSEPEFEYSNVGAGLAGHYLELTTGSTLQEHAAAKLFEPLGMQNTGWTRESIAGSTLAIPHGLVDDEIVAVVYELATYPDGGLRSSASDLAQFMAMIMSGGELNDVRYLSSDSVAEMTQKSSPESDYGLFWEAEDGLVGHGGSDPGADTYMFFNPLEQIGVVVLVNGDEYDETAYDQMIAELFESAAQQ